MSYSNISRYTDVQPASVSDVIAGRDLDITLDELCDIIAEKLVEEYIYTGGRRVEKGSRWTKGGHDRVYAPCGFYYDLSDGKIGGVGVSYVAPWLERTMSIVTATVEEHIVEPVDDDDTITDSTDDTTSDAPATATTDDAPATDDDDTTTADDIVRISEAAASTLTVDDHTVRISADARGVRYGRHAAAAMLKATALAHDLDITDIDDAVSIAAQAITDLADTEISHTSDIVSVIIDVAGADPIEYATTPRTVDTVCDAIEDTIVDEAGISCIRSVTVIGVDIDDVARAIVGGDVYDKLVGDVDWVALHAADAVEIVGMYDIDDTGAVLLEAAAAHAIVD